MAKFDSKTWNPTVFEKYRKKVPNVKENALIKNGLLNPVTNTRARLTDEVGGNYIIEPIKGLLDGQVLNYDGVVDMAATSRDTFEQGKIIVGRMKAWTEKDFSTELTGEDWMKGLAAEVNEYYDGVDQNTLLAILAGIFGMNDGSGFVDAHTTDISEDEEGVVSSVTLNNAIQKASGDKKKLFKVAIMHSMVATNLENLNLLEYLKYTDSEGIQKDLGLATWNGRLVIIDDEMPTEEVDAEYELTSDVAIDSSKTYYTRSGSGTSQSPYVYTAVEDPDVDDIATYYEIAAEAYTAYTTYVLGEKFFDYDNVGVKVPNEMGRDPKTNGGLDTLYTRQRKLFVPKWISFTKSQMASNSPTDAELADGRNWEVVNNGKAGANKAFVNHKMIPLARIISRG